MHTMNKLNEDRVEDAELSDDEFEELSFDVMLDRVESRDHSLTKLKVPLGTLVPNINGYRHGLDSVPDRWLTTAIGRNTQLKALVADGDGEQINEAQAMILFRDIACNRSIKRFHFKSCGEYLGNACRILAPLFKNNQVERIRIYNRNLSPESTRLLLTSLAEFDSLKEFALTHARIQHNPESERVVRELIHALSCHSRLRKLDLSHTNFGKLGCSALVDLLSNPNINIRVLDLTSNNLGDAEAAALSSGMAGNVSLKEINFAYNSGITQAGWQALFGTLSNSICRLEKLTLRDNEINDAAAQSLSNALTSNTTLKTLNLGTIDSITLTGWRVLFDFLRSRACVLEDLDLNYNQLNDEVMTFLTDALASNRSLSSLDLSANDEVTGAGWQRFISTVLTNPSSELEKLDLDYCGINNATIRAITDALINDGKVKMLALSGNGLITNAGWEMFSSVLESPNTALEELDLRGNCIHNDTATLLVNSLANNKTLKKLCVGYSDDWEPPLSLLCNTNSIMSTYNSNHTLEVLGRGDRYLPDDLVYMLKINRGNSSNQAARIKILATHFNEGFVTQPFVGMDLIMLPRAMAWMSRDGRIGEINGHFYVFIRSMASLFENAPDKGNKRKRNE